jgi:nitrate reductase gamma subunit
MDWFSFLATGVLVYTAALVFIIGMGWQIYRWFKAPVSPMKLGLFPKPSASGRWWQMLRDVFFFPQVAEVDFKMWLAVLAFHLGIIGAFIGHLRLIHEFTPLASAIGLANMDWLGLFGGGTMGIILLVTLAYFLLRRFSKPYRQLSLPEDYLLLILLLSLILMGDHLRFSGHVPVTVFRQYVTSILTFKPALPAALAGSSLKWAFVTHVLLADLLFIYFPFSKLVHFVGTFATNLIRRT